MTDDDVRPGLRAVLAADLRANRAEPRIQALLLLFRVTGRLRSSRNPLARVVGVPLAALYRSYATVVTSIDLPTSTRVGPGLRIWHGYALVVHAQAVIGAGVTLRHSTTIGERTPGRGAPTLGDHVDVGAQCAVLGPVTIGQGASLGSGAVVLSDCPPGGTMVGNPARLVTH